MPSLNQDRIAPAASLRDVYAHKALSQVPRLLSLQDRNEYSRTYGCFNREYWLCRATDFPSSIAQFGTHALAMAWATPFPGSRYYQHPKMLEWTKAGIDYWMGIQKGDGSFDEFYPNERGWAGPTGFLLYAMISSFRLVRPHVDRGFEARFLETAARAARFLAKYDEPGVLANHHAMAILPIYEAYDLLGDEALRRGFEVRTEDFLRYCYEEGWCLEYDGADLGYLSATVSFLAKLQKRCHDERLDAVCRRAIDFAAHFVYPNGHYAGSMGSRQTLHFYPHGFEIYGGQGNALASAVAERMLRGLADGALVPPEIQEDRYFLYRIPEFMESWIDWSPRPAELPPLPYEREPFTRYWPGARIYARRGRDARGRDYYALVNLAKGGVVKLFRLDTNTLVENDCGLLAELANGKVVTSQWIDPDYRVAHHPAGDGAIRPPGGKATPAASSSDHAFAGDQPGGDTLPGEGQPHLLVMKVFTPVTMIAFRLFMIAFGWQTRLAYEIKGLIRRLLMTRSDAAALSFRRRVVFGETGLLIEDEIRRGHGPRIMRATIGDEFHPRYVPQSRYFQLQELDVHGRPLSKEELERLNREGSLRRQHEVDYHGEEGKARP